MTASTLRLNKWVGDWCHVFDLARRSSTSCFLKPWPTIFVGLATSSHLCFIIVVNLIFMCSRLSRNFLWISASRITIPRWRRGMLSTVKEFLSVLFLCQNQNQNCYWQSKWHTPGPGPGRLVPGSHQLSELSNSILGTFSRGDNRVSKCNPWWSGEKATLINTNRLLAVLANADEWWFLQRLTGSGGGGRGWIR